MLYVLRYYFFQAEKANISKIGRGKVNSKVCDKVFYPKETSYVTELVKRVQTANFYFRLPFFFYSPLSDTTRVWSRHVRDFLRWDFNEHVGYFSESSSTPVALILFA